MLRSAADKQFACRIVVSKSALTRWHDWVHDNRCRALGRAIVLTQRELCAVAKIF